MPSPPVRRFLSAATPARLLPALLGGVLLIALAAFLQIPRPESLAARFAAGIPRTEAYLARARAAYRPGDWRSTYWFAVRICELREIRTLARTQGARTEVLPETNVQERELAARLDEAARLARTDAQRQAVRYLEIRAFRGLYYTERTEPPGASEF